MRTMEGDTARKRSPRENGHLVERTAKQNEQFGAAASRRPERHRRRRWGVGNAAQLLHSRCHRGPRVFRVRISRTGSCADDVSAIVRKALCPPPDQRISQRLVALILATPPATRSR